MSAGVQLFFFAWRLLFGGLGIGNCRFVLRRPATGLLNQLGKQLVLLGLLFLESAQFGFQGVDLSLRVLHRCDPGVVVHADQGVGEFETGGIDSVPASAYGIAEVFRGHLIRVDRFGKAGQFEVELRCNHRCVRAPSTWTGTSPINATLLP